MVPTFCLCGEQSQIKAEFRLTVSSKRIETLCAMLEPAVNAVGMELWGVEYISQGRHSILRVFIDSENGVSIENCEAASHQLSGVLDVEDPINGEYNLEVSSPGLDRPFFKFSQYAGFEGELIKVRLQLAVDGMRNFTGRLVAAENDQLTFEVDSKTLTVSINQIDKANLVPTFD